MHRIGVVTGTRAEYGLLKPLMQKIEQDSQLELYLVVTGAHLEQRFGYTCREIEADGFRINWKADMDLSSDTAGGICHSVGKEMEGLAGAFDKAGIDLLILLGDRYETLAAALAASLFHIPVAHIHGGEATEGAMDDAFRHAITKLSCLHFAAAEEYKRRIIQMGEQPEQVHNTGAIGVENIRCMELVGKQQLAKKFTGLFLGKYIMVTYHPATLDGRPVQEQMQELLAVFLENPEYNYIFTYANADHGGVAVNKMIDRFVKENPNAAAFKSMGQAGYLSALKGAWAVAGNSSSGIIEAPSFHIPTIDIGDRQKGRICGESVIHCGSSAQEIRKAFQKAADPGFRRTCQNCRNPYEGGNTSVMILEEIKKELEQGISLRKKFYDMRF